jgi:hypothetical protein
MPGRAISVLDTLTVTASVWDCDTLTLRSAHQTTTCCRTPMVSATSMKVRRPEPQRSQFDAAGA